MAVAAGMHTLSHRKNTHTHTCTYTAVARLRLLPTRTLFSFTSPLAGPPVSACCTPRELHAGCGVTHQRYAARGSLRGKKLRYKP